MSDFISPELAERMMQQRALQQRMAPAEGPMLDGMAAGELYAGYADPVGLEVVSGVPAVAMGQPTVVMSDPARPEPAKIPMTMAPGMGVVYGQQAEAAERARPFMSLEQAARTLEMVEAEKKRRLSQKEKSGSDDPPELAANDSGCILRP